LSNGDLYDNALAEAVNALFKTELIYRRGPSNLSWTMNGAQL
jgi:hypothetical protein